MIAFDLVNWKRAIIHFLKPRIRHSKDRYRNLKEGKEKNITAPKQQYLTSCLLDNILKSPRHQFFKCQSQLAKYEWLLMGCPFVQRGARRMGIFMYGCYVFSSMRLQVQQCSISKIQLNCFFKASYGTIRPLLIWWGLPYRCLEKWKPRLFWILINLIFWSRISLILLRSLKVLSFKLDKISELSCYTTLPWNSPHKNPNVSFVTKVTWFNFCNNKWYFAAFLWSKSNRHKSQ